MAPGYYVLPFREGWYMIDGNGKVAMSPRRSGTCYHHDHVMLTNITNEINFGWYSIVLSSGHTSDFKVLKIAPTHFHTDHSIQSTWFLNQVDFISDKPTVIEMKKHL